MRELVIGSLRLAFLSATALLFAACGDGFHCTELPCGSGRSWMNCLECSGDDPDRTCTNEARDDQGAVLFSCEYPPCENSGSCSPAGKACNQQVQSAGDTWCAQP